MKKKLNIIGEEFIFKFTLKGRCGNNLGTVSHKEMQEIGESLRDKLLDDGLDVADAEIERS